MKRKRFSEAQIIGVLQEAEAGVKKQDFCRETWDHRELEVLDCGWP